MLSPLVLSNDLQLCRNNAKISLHHFSRHLVIFQHYSNTYRAWQIELILGYEFVIIITAQGVPFFVFLYYKKCCLSFIQCTVEISREYWACQLVILTESINRQFCNRYFRFCISHALKSPPNVFREHVDAIVKCCLASKLLPWRAPVFFSKLYRCQENFHIKFNVFSLPRIIQTKLDLVAKISQ